MPPRRVLAIDPGREKCGVAVLDAAAGLLERAVVARGELPVVLQQWCVRHRPDLLLLGTGTGSRELMPLLSGLPVPVQRVSEQHTTRGARARYFVEHPPRGWRRWLPLTLQTPPVPVDDYAAWIIAEQFFSQLPVD